MAGVFIRSVCVIKYEDSFLTCVARKRDVPVSSRKVEIRGLERKGVASAKTFEKYTPRLGSSRRRESSSGKRREEKKRPDTSGTRKRRRKLR
jgi:hypothetical protein